jgi:type I restriction enzyme S subunit
MALAKRLPVAMVTRPVAFNQDIKAIEPHRSIWPKYLLYALLASEKPILALTDEAAHGTKRLDAGLLRGFRIPCPELADQKRIAGFLDVATARIDALVDARQRMTELLDERWASRRRSLTGIRQPDYPESSIQLRRIARLQAGSAFPHDYQGDASGTIPYVKVGDLANVDENDRLVESANRVAPSVAKQLHSPILPVGTIVLPKIGAALLNNRRAILTEPSCLDQNVLGVTVTGGSVEYVYHCLAAIDLGDLSTPGPVPLLNEEAAKSLRIPWPATSAEQISVARALRHTRRVHLAPARSVRRQIALLRERRQALITAAVAGKLQVPDTPMVNAVA